ncbi:hypothetical protein A3A60_04500 [Candidatus Curtissbacteria bacterium RIFCSPLOWO2_01_FULL_42_26]|uniref:Uncharacterized protein n=1 Tax=Candidatus Curtissbacteria bacterium RIFCSPLOWO2_01_FULL_42_26 TaxID=1797729 RepID=A0A1F5HXB3_9BACT|nr:MAG: hypothetical protein A3A60_04500 [Candidatus Curtissbacteria bacterium RIFCSPLOWO2_01_FULL_42_26]
MKEKILNLIDSFRLLSKYKKITILGLVILIASAATASFTVYKITGKNLPSTKEALNQTQDEANPPQVAGVSETNLPSPSPSPTKSTKLQKASPSPSPSPQNQSQPTGNSPQNAQPSQNSSQNQSPSSSTPSPSPTPDTTPFEANLSTEVQNNGNGWTTTAVITANKALSSCLLEFYGGSLSIASSGNINDNSCTGSAGLQNPAAVFAEVKSQSGDCQVLGGFPPSGTDGC